MQTSIFAKHLPFQFLVFTLAGFIQREQQDVIDYLREENRVLRQQLRGRRLVLTDAERRRLAIGAKKLGRATLKQFASIFTPDTLMRWYRRLVASSPNLNAFAERFVGSIRRECLDHIIPLG